MKVKYLEKKDGCWKSFHSNVSKYMLKTLLYPEEWPDSTLCFLLFQINNKNWFCLTRSHERVVLPSLETPEMFFLISLSPDILNTFGSALDLSNVKHYAWRLQGIYDFWATWAGPQHHSVLLQLCLLGATGTSGTGTSGTAAVPKVSTRLTGKC